jgi:hypothetical protein
MTTTDYLINAVFVFVVLRQARERKVDARSFLSDGDRSGPWPGDLRFAPGSAPRRRAVSGGCVMDLLSPS